MTPEFSPFLAHLLMAGLARRAMLSTEVRAEPVKAERPQTQKPLPVQQQPAEPSAGTADTR